MNTTNIKLDVASFTHVLSELFATMYYPILQFQFPKSKQGYTLPAVPNYHQMSHLPPKLIKDVSWEAKVIPVQVYTEASKVHNICIVEH